MPSKKSDPDLAWLPIAEIKRWDRNPRRHPERQVRALAAMLRRVGFINPVVLWPSRDRLASGHGRLDAVELIERETPGAVLPNAPAAGMVRVLRHEFASDADATAYALGDNRLPELAEDDDAEIAALLRESDEETRALFEDDPSEPAEQIAVEPFDVSALSVASFTIEINGPLVVQPIVLAKLRAAIGDMDGIKIRATEG